MSPWAQVPAISGVGFELSLGEACQSSSFRANLRRALLQAATEKLLKDAIQENALAVSGEELQAAVDRFRAARGLHSAQATRRWLRRQNMTEDDLEHSLEHGLLVAKLRARIPHEHIQVKFDNEQAQYARAKVRQIIVRSEGAAQEMLARLTEEGADFAALARQFSTDPGSRVTGGALGTIQRRQMPLDIADKIFGAHPGALVGPWRGKRGVYLFQVEELLPASLDAPTENAIRHRLFNEWLRDQLARRKLTFPMLDEA